MSIYDKASLVLIPSGTKTSKVYSQVPTNGDGDFTFSRSTAATRVNASGNIEKETQNLLVQSNSFDTTWTLNSTSVTSGQSGYDGSSDAWRLNSTTTGFPRIEQTLSASGVLTLSVYAKPATDGFMLIRTFGADAQVWFNLNDGTIPNAAGAQYVSSSIESIGSGWYRCSVVANGSLTSLRFYPASAYGVYSTSGNGVYIQDAQLEQGLVARDYIETTTTAIYGGITDNVPRLDYTDSSCPALLLEPQRTNLFNHSEYFGDWGVSAGTLTANAGTSPEGLNNAYLFTEDTTTGYHRFAKNAGASGSNKTFSVYAKWAGGTGSKWLTLDNGPVGYFDLENGVVGTAQGSLSLSMEDAGDGWYRCTIYNPASVTGTMYIGCANTNGGAGNHLGNGQPAFYVYGAQCEDNSSYATSYIPTYGSAVTRNADNPTELTNLSTDGLLNNYNSSAFIHIKKNLGTTGLARFLALYSASGNNPRILLYAGNNSTFFSLNLQYRVSGQSDVGDFMGTFNNDEEIKVAFVLNGTTMTSYVNGVKKNTNTIVQGADIEKLFLDDAGELSHLVSKLLVFPTALTDQEAIDLTTI